MQLPLIAIFSLISSFHASVCGPYGVLADPKHKAAFTQRVYMWARRLRSCQRCRLCAMTQGCMLKHVMGIAALRSLRQRRKATGRTCTSGKTWLHYPRSSLLTAPLPHLTRASLPSSPSLFIFSLSSMSPGQTVLLLSWCLAAPAPNTLTSTTCSRIHLQFMLL